MVTKLSQKRVEGKDEYCLKDKLSNFTGDLFIF